MARFFRDFFFGGPGGLWPGSFCKGYSIVSVGVGGYGIYFFWLGSGGMLTLVVRLVR